MVFVSATPGDYELSLCTPVEQVVRPTGLLDPKIEVRPLERGKGRVVSLSREFKNLAFDIRVSDFSSVVRADCYVMNRSATNVLGVLGYTPYLGPEWQTVCIPRERFLPKEGGGIDPAKADRIRIGFFLHKGIKPTTIRISGIDFVDRTLPGRNNSNRPGK